MPGNFFFFFKRKVKKDRVGGFQDRKTNKQSSIIIWNSLLVQQLYWPLRLDGTRADLANSARDIQPTEGQWSAVIQGWNSSLDARVLPKLLFLILPLNVFWITDLTHTVTGQLLAGGLADLGQLCSLLCPRALYVPLCYSLLKLLLSTITLLRTLHSYPALFFYSLFHSLYEHGIKWFHITHARENKRRRYSQNRCANNIIVFPPPKKSHQVIIPKSGWLGNHWHPLSLQVAGEAVEFAVERNESHGHATQDQRGREREHGSRLQFHDQLWANLRGLL